VLGRYVYERLRRVLLPDFRRQWTRDLDARLKDVQDTLSHVEAQVAQLRRTNRQLVLSEWDARRAALLNQIDGRLSAEAIRGHICQSVAAAALHTEPTTHLVIDSFLPPDFYELLLAAIPPAEAFPDRDPVKTDFEMDALDEAPELTRRVWRFFDEQVVRGILAPAILERCREGVIDHYSETGGREFGERAAAIPHRPFAGRIQLRRPGYQLRPHLDPKRVAVTGLMYLARNGESETYGTQLYTVDRPFVASGMKTFFPEEAGMRCELARDVPFRPNTLLAFVNSRAAHGASLPPGAPLDERYTFQFYLKPDDGSLKKLLKDLPESARASWEGF
jgi:hypothetical protein